MYLQAHSLVKPCLVRLTILACEVTCGENVTGRHPADPMWKFCRWLLYIKMSKDQDHDTWMQTKHLQCGSLSPRSLSFGHCSNNPLSLSAQAPTSRAWHQFLHWDFGGVPTIIVIPSGWLRGYDCITTLYNNIVLLFLQSPNDCVYDQCWSGISKLSGPTMFIDFRGRHW